MHEDFISLKEFSELSGITRMSILKWAREYEFHLEEKRFKNSVKYYIDVNLVTVFKEIKTIRRELQKFKIIESCKGRSWKVNTQDVKKYSAFKVGDLYEVYKNDRKSPIKLGYFKFEQLMGYDVYIF